MTISYVQIQVMIIQIKHLHILIICAELHSSVTLISHKLLLIRFILIIDALVTFRALTVQ